MKKRNILWLNQRLNQQQQIKFNSATNEDINLDSVVCLLMAYTKYSVYKTCIIKSIIFKVSWRNVAPSNKVNLKLYRISKAYSTNIGPIQGRKIEHAWDLMFSIPFSKFFLDSGVCNGPSKVPFSNGSPILTCLYTSTSWSSTVWYMLSWISFNSSKQRVQSYGFLILLSLDVEKETENLVLIIPVYDKLCSADQLYRQQQIGQNEQLVWCRHHP